jgi:hypothetical protein
LRFDHFFFFCFTIPEGSMLMEVCGRWETTRMGAALARLRLLECGKRSAMVDRNPVDLLEVILRFVNRPSLMLF